jgi:biopolymer transport protein ExbD
VRFASSRHRERVERLEITSLVDVVFLLIIFFLTTSSLVELSKANIELAKAAGEKDASTESNGLVINIDEDGRYIVESETIGFADLMRKVEAEVGKSGGPEMVELVIRADRRAMLASVNRLAEGLVDMEVTKWRLATERPPEAPGAPPEPASSGRTGGAR